MTSHNRVTIGGIVDPLASAKDNAEIRLAKLVSEGFGTQLQSLLALEVTELQNLSPAFWTAHGETMLGLIGPELQSSFDEAGLFTINEFPIQADFALVNQEAINYVNIYGFDLIRDLNSTSFNNLRSAITRFLQTPGFTLGDLEAMLIPTFGPKRAAGIAVTETTRAFAFGQVSAANLARINGLDVEEVWRTNMDALVCPICAPNDGLRRSQGWTVNGIPGHPNCRCWYSHSWEV